MCWMRREERYRAKREGGREGMMGIPEFRKLCLRCAMYQCICDEIDREISVGWRNRMELITRSDDERLEITSKEWFNTLKHNDPLTRDVAKVVCFFIDSLRAALKDRDDERKAKYCEREFKEMAMKELNEALSR